MPRRRKQAVPKVEVIEDEPVRVWVREFEQIPRPLGVMHGGKEHRVQLLYTDGRAKGIAVIAENAQEAISYARLHNLMTSGERLLARGGVTVVR